MTGKNQLRKSFDGVIRPARAGDLPAIMVIENSCFDEEAYEPEDMDEYLQKSIGNPKTPFLLAFERAAANDSQPGGYALGDMESADTGHIIGIAVMKTMRGGQLGRLLLDRVSESLRNAGARCIELEVRADNEPAIHLYETAGFVKTADIPDYYGPGAHGIEMARILDEPGQRPA